MSLEMLREAIDNYNNNEEADVIYKKNVALAIRLIEKIGITETGKNNFIKTQNEAFALSIFLKQLGADILSASAQLMHVAGQDFEDFEKDAIIFSDYVKNYMLRAYKAQEENRNRQKRNEH